jgi:hypothetical protein
MAKKHPLRYRELINRLKQYGIKIRIGFGKGSEVVLIKPEKPGTNKGPIFTIKHHGDGDEIIFQVIDAILRRFNISKRDFWSE